MQRSLAQQENISANIADNARTHTPAVTPSKSRAATAADRDPTGTGAHFIEHPPTSSAELSNSSSNTPTKPSRADIGHHRHTKFHSGCSACSARWGPSRRGPLHGASAKTPLSRSSPAKAALRQQAQAMAAHNLSSGAPASPAHHRTPSAAQAEHIQSLKNKISELVAERDTMEEEIEELRAQNESLQEQLDEEINDIDSNEEMMCIIGELEQNNAQLQQQITDLKLAKSKLEDRIAELEHLLENVALDTESLEDRLTQAQEDNQDLRNQLQEAHNEQESLSQMVSELQQQRRASLQPNPEPIPPISPAENGIERVEHIIQERCTDGNLNRMYQQIVQVVSDRLGPSCKVAVALKRPEDPDSVQCMAVTSNLDHELVGRVARIQDVSSIGSRALQQGHVIVVQPDDGEMLQGEFLSLHPREGTLVSRDSVDSSASTASIDSSADSTGDSPAQDSNTAPSRSSLLSIPFKDSQGYGIGYINVESIGLDMDHIDFLEATAGCIGVAVEHVDNKSKLSQMRLSFGLPEPDYALYSPLSATQTCPALPSSSSVAAASARSRSSLPSGSSAGLVPSDGIASSVILSRRRRSSCYGQITHSMRNSPISCFNEAFELLQHMKQRITHLEQQQQQQSQSAPPSDLQATPDLDTSAINDVLLEEMQQRIDQLQSENASLRSSVESQRQATSQAKAETAAAREQAAVAVAAAASSSSSDQSAPIAADCDCAPHIAELRSSLQSQQEELETLRIQTTQLQDENWQLRSLALHSNRPESELDHERERHLVALEEAREELEQQLLQCQHRLRKTEVELDRVSAESAQLEQRLRSEWNKQHRLSINQQQDLRRSTHQLEITNSQTIEQLRTECQQLRSENERMTLQIASFQRTNAMKIGSRLYKYSFNSKQSRRAERLLQLDPDESRLTWKKVSATKIRSVHSVPLGLVQDVLIGPASANFRRRQAREDPDYLCFSLVLNDRTIDLAATDRDQLEVWVLGLQHIVSRHNAAVRVLSVAQLVEEQQRVMLAASNA